MLLLFNNGGAVIGENDVLGVVGDLADEVAVDELGGLLGGKLSRP